MISRRSSGSMRAESAVEPTRSANITVTGGARAVPGSLLEHEPQVVFGRDREIVVVYPAKLHGLPFRGDEYDKTLESLISLASRAALSKMDLQRAAA